MEDFPSFEDDFSIEESSPSQTQKISELITKFKELKPPIQYLILGIVLVVIVVGMAVVLNNPNVPEPTPTPSPITSLEPTITPEPTPSGECSNNMDCGITTASRCLEEPYCKSLTQITKYVPDTCQNICSGGVCTPCLPSCKKQTETCLAGQICENGECVDACGDGDCDSSIGETCETCQNDCSCLSSQICVNATCISKIPCASEGDCPEGFYCYAGFCVKCMSDTDCGATTASDCPQQHCEDSITRTYYTPTTCQNTCNNGACVICSPECTKHTETCSAGQICSNGGCVSQTPTYTPTPIPSPTSTPSATPTSTPTVTATPTPTAAPECGDWNCGVDEDPCNCPNDCSLYDFGWECCPFGTMGYDVGYGCTGTSETCQNHYCVYDPNCGNSFCDSSYGETANSCPQDCCYTSGISKITEKCHENCPSVSPFCHGRNPGDIVCPSSTKELTCCKGSQTNCGTSTITCPADVCNNAYTLKNYENSATCNNGCTFGFGCQGCIPQCQYTFENCDICCNSACHTKDPVCIYNSDCDDGDPSTVDECQGSSSVTLTCGMCVHKAPDLVPNVYINGDNLCQVDVTNAGNLVANNFYTTISIGYAGFSRYTHTFQVGPVTLPPGVTAMFWTPTDTQTNLESWVIGEVIVDVNNDVTESNENNNLGGFCRISYFCVSTYLDGWCADICNSNPSSPAYDLDC